MRHARRDSRTFAAVVVGTALLLFCPGTVLAASVGRQNALPLPTPRCRVTDDGLSELSGLVSDGDDWYAVSDGGNSLKVFTLDPRDCSVRDVRTEAIDPYDVEDLEIDGDGDLWLADIGDNSLQRETVAVHVMAADGGATLYRLSYRDGAHNAEALLLGPDGIPHIITKEPFGSAGIYRPAEPLVAGATVPLERVGSVTVPSTDTPGGPLPGTLSSMVVTGGAVSHDGTVVALRTYTDAYLFRVPHGDLVAALQNEPLRVPLPHEPQGEAIALEPDGTLLSGSEGRREPVRAVPGAVAEVKAANPPDPTVSSERGARSGDAPVGKPAAASSDGDVEEGLPSTQALIIAGGIAAVLLVGARRFRRRPR